MKHFWVVVENYYINEYVNTLFAVRGRGFPSFSESGRYTITVFYKCYEPVEVIAHYKGGGKEECRKFRVDRSVFIDRSLKIRELTEEQVERIERRDRLIIDEMQLARWKRWV